MGHVFKPRFTKPLPDGAEIITRRGERFARWRDRQGHTHTEPLTTNAAGVDRLSLQARTYSAKYKDGSGLLRTVATGCHDKDAARSVLAQLEKRSDLVRSGLRSANEDACADRLRDAIETVIADYLEYLRNKRGKGAKANVSPRHIANVEHRLRVLAADCGFKRLCDLNRKPVERWVRQQVESGELAPQSINNHISTLCAFANWAVSAGRLQANPIARLSKLDAKADRRRHRRALTTDELARLLRAARLRPIAELGREAVALPPHERRGRRSWRLAPLSWDSLDGAYDRGLAMLANDPERRAALQRTGHNRALYYKLASLTGLRRAEIASLAVGSIELDGAVAYVTLRAADAKSGNGAEQPLRRDLASDLRAWLAERLDALRSEARATDEPLPARLPADEPLFGSSVPTIRVFDHDLRAAGIPKRDDRGQSADIHSLRTTFATHLSRGGVAPRTAQAALRHSTIELTMQAYTDPRLLDVAGAMDALPDLPLDGADAQQAKATGTLGQSVAKATTLAPLLALDPGQQGLSPSIADKPNCREESGRSSVSVDPDSTCALLSTPDGKRVTGLEPATFSLGS